jgi:polysaccharide biosynthesis PFTS motif protein
LFRKTNIAASRLPLWFRVFEFEYNFWFCIYEAVFRKFEVKILIHFQEASWKQAVQSKALESAGGVMVGYNWSNYYVPKMPSHLFPHHAYFIWGESIGAHMRSIKNVSRYILPSGLWLTEAEEIPAESGRLKKGLDFVMAIFDSSVSHSGIYSHVSLTRFYLDILRLLESNANWGGIIKNKNYDYSRLKDLPRGGEIISKINRLMKAERLIALGCSFSPLAAAARADLCVCYGFNSAGIVTGTCGYRTIHWDCSGISPRPFCDEADQKVIYGSYDDLEKAILRAASGDRTIGDFSKWSRNFNYFGDFLAPGRIALFIRSFMDEALKTGDADGALVAEVRKYIEDNGLEKKQENACVQNRLCTPSENVF